MVYVILPRLWRCLCCKLSFGDCSPPLQSRRSNVVSNSATVFSSDEVLVLRLVFTLWGHWLDFWERRFLLEINSKKYAMPMYQHENSNRFVHTQVVSILMGQKDSGFKVRPLLKALRSAAVMALPPKAAAADDGDDVRENSDVGEEDAEEAVSGSMFCFQMWSYKYPSTV